MSANANTLVAANHWPRRHKSGDEARRSRPTGCHRAEYPGTRRLQSSRGGTKVWSVDPLWGSFELHELLTRLGVAPQLDRPPHEASLLRRAVFLDQLLDAGTPFRRCDSIDRHRVCESSADSRGTLSPIAQHGRIAARLRNALLSRGPDSPNSCRACSGLDEGEVTFDVPRHGRSLCPERDIRSCRERLTLAY